MSDPNELVAALKPVAEALSLLRIPHYVGGSVASSYHGAVRSTMDIDIVCQMREEQVGPFISQFDDGFYISESAIRQAIRRRSCFNLIHFETSERQWDDVSRLVRLTGNALDTDYLAASAQMVGVSDLLLRLLDKASR